MKRVVKRVVRIYSPGHAWASRHINDLPRLISAFEHFNDFHRSLRWERLLRKTIRNPDYDISRPLEVESLLEFEDDFV